MNLPQQEPELSELVRREVDTLCNDALRFLDNLTLLELLEDYNPYLMSITAISKPNLIEYLIERSLNKQIEETIEWLVQEAPKFAIDVPNSLVNTIDLFVYWKEIYEENLSFAYTKSRITSTLALQFHHNFENDRHETDWKRVVKFVSGNYYLQK